MQCKYTAKCICTNSEAGCDFRSFHIEGQSVDMNEFSGAVFIVG